MPSGRSNSHCSPLTSNTAGSDTNPPDLSSCGPLKTTLISTVRCLSFIIHSQLCLDRSEHSPLRAPRTRRHVRMRALETHHAVIERRIAEVENRSLARVRPAEPLAPHRSPERTYLARRESASLEEPRREFNIRRDLSPRPVRPSLDANGPRLARHSIQVMKRRDSLRSQVPLPIRVVTVARSRHGSPTVEIWNDRNNHIVRKNPACR